ncbi:uncharacterized protein LOC133883844 [Phragmites australis]|uniref:uncharacterized protein LOC133883844 n=1 Tax=Phragmites australis TaxID=29695 RepID=UPI002D76EBDD|nr:uncharacterized protein LOC133883844 [Phragmites australis]
MDRCRAAGVHASSVHRLDKLGCRGGDDFELDVFDAERYFNGDDALWCARSSSSFSSAFRTATHEHNRSIPTPTAATSSSDASWNSRSALLPGGKVLPVATTPDIEAEPSGTGSECRRRKPVPSSQLRWWLIGVAGCACAGGDGEESLSADEFRDEVEADNDVLGVRSKNRSTEGGELFPSTESNDLAVEETTTVRVRPVRWLDDGDAFLAEAAEFDAVQLSRDGHRRAANLGVLSTPILYPATTSTSDERRRKSLQTFRPVGDQERALGSATQNSAFTIVAGSTARGGAAHKAAAYGARPGTPHIPCGSPRDSGEDDAAPSELECAYPPSEASVVWSVVTADGAASGNNSSAASGYYHYFNDGEHEALRHATVKGNRRRRDGFANSVLLTCMSEKAVDVVGPDWSVHRPEVEPGAVARLGAASRSRNRLGGGYPDVMRHR